MVAIRCKSGLLLRIRRRDAVRADRLPNNVSARPWLAVSATGLASAPRRPCCHTGRDRPAVKTKVTYKAPAHRTTPGRRSDPYGVATVTQSALLIGGTGPGPPSPRVEARGFAADDLAPGNTKCPGGDLRHLPRRVFRRRAARGLAMRRSTVAIANTTLRSIADVLQGRVVASVHRGLPVVPRLLRSGVHAPPGLPCRP